MGLDVSHGDFSLSYSSFAELRTKISSSLGFELNSFQGFGGNRQWNELKSPIKALLNHSDCDGELTVKEMTSMIPELIKISSLWEEGFYKNYLNKLINSMQLAIKAKQKLIFS